MKRKRAFHGFISALELVAHRADFLHNRIFFRYFLRLLYRAAAEAYKRSAGRHPDAADGSPSYRSRLFSADAVCAGYADRFLGL